MKYFSLTVFIALKFFTVCSQTSDDYIEKGTKYYAVGKYVEAIDNFTLAINISRAYAYSMLGNLSAAIGDYSKALQLSPNDPGLYYTRATAYSAKENSVLALEDFSKAIAIDSLDADFFYKRGLTFESLGKYPEATADYSKVLELDPEDSEKQ